MNRFSFLLCITVLLFAGCGDIYEAEKGDGKTPSNFSAKDFPAEKGTLFGAWQGTETKAGSGTSFRLFFNRTGQVGMEMVCGNDKGNFRSSASATVKVDANTFTIQNHMNGTSQGGCNFTYAPGTLIYFMQDEILNTSAPQESGIKMMTRLW